MERWIAALMIWAAAAAPAMAQDAFTGPRVSVSLESKPPAESGLRFESANAESAPESVTRGNRSAWQAKRFLYFTAADPRLREGALPLVKILVDYFDEGRGVVLLQYDSSDPTVNPGARAGTWKGRKAFVLQGSRQWKRAEITLDDALFAGRCNGADFRLESRDGPVVASRVEVVAADDAAQRRNREARAKTTPLEARIEPFTLTLQQVREKLRPYDGPSEAGTDPSTLTGKVMAGYQGWHGAPGDASGLGWVHLAEYARFEPGDCHVEYWPDTSEMDADEQYPTHFRHRDGRVATVFSPMNAKTVQRHFRWMQEAGIDGVWVQRFAGPLKDARVVNKNNTVLMNVREAANRLGRTYCVMYDLSGARDTEAILDDWKSLVDRMGIGRDPKDRAYQRHRGKPVVALWGLFADRGYCLPAFERLVDVMKNDPRCGGFTVMVGVNNDWREAKTPNHERVRRVIEQADIVSPWTVGRYGSIPQAEWFIRLNNAPDQEWCGAHGKEYLPVVFPGFSWSNMHGGLTPMDAIPRLQGCFFWRQVVAAKRAGARMLFVAMFDEIDEGTAIFKCTNDPPVGETPFLDFEGLPSDTYLWLAGQARRLLAGEIPETLDPPARAGLSIRYKPVGSTDLPSGAREISVVLTNPQTRKGMAFQEQGDECRSAPTTKAGQPGWTALPANAQATGRMLYFRVEYGEFQGTAAPRLELAVDYFDEGNATVRVVYDSRDLQFRGVPGAPGAWKEAGRFTTGGTGTWKTARFPIDDALFLGRCNGWDVRLEVQGNTNLTIGAARLKRAD